MNHSFMVERLAKAGVHFDAGLSGEEIKRIENTFGFCFPKEIASFLACAYPVGDKFFDYRDTSPENIDRFYGFQKSITESFLFDIEHNTDLLQKMLKGLLGEFTDPNEFKNAVLNALEKSTKLIPFYAHRCFFDGMDGMPILSFWQAVDTIIYGYDFENYLVSEFLCTRKDDFSEETYRKIKEKLKETGIWYYIID